MNLVPELLSCVEKLSRNGKVLPGPGVRWATAVVGVLLSASTLAEPFVTDPMPSGFDGVYFATGSPNYSAPSLKPVAVDFNGDGQTSWYAGGRQVAHPKTPTPLDPDRYVNSALPAVSLAACPSCTPRYRAFAVGDVNRDGNPDIVRINEWIGQSYTYTLQVFLGGGDNTFAAGWREDFQDSPGFNAGDIYFQIALADFDRDGDPDLAVLTTYQFTNTDASPHFDAGNLRIRWNQANTFAMQSVLQSKHFDVLAKLYVADLDRDGDDDIMVNSRTIWTQDDTYSPTASFFTNAGSGTFSVANDSAFVATEGFIDINRDSFPDFVTYQNNVFGGPLSWANNNHAGSFNNLTVYTQEVISGLPLAFADFDEDGVGDLLSGETISGQNALVLRRGQSNSTLGTAQTMSTLPSAIVQLGVGDARGDADQDVLLRLANNTFQLARNQAQRLDSWRGTSTVAFSQNGLSKLKVVDMNLDGIDDLLALQPSGSHAYLSLGNNVGGFNPAEFKILANGPSDITVGDFNRDARPDFAYVVPGADQVRTVTQNGNIFFGWADTSIGTFDGAALISAGNAITNNATTDLLVASNTTGGLRWYLNNGGAISWTGTSPVATQDPIPQSLALVPHYHGFGDAAMSCASNDIAFYINGYNNILGWNRYASLLQVQSVAQSGFCASVDIAADLEKELVFVDGDGRLVWWNPDDNPVVTTSTIANSVPGMVNAITAVDWNADGLKDLLVATTQGLYLYVREGQTDAWVQRLLYADTVLGVTDVVAIDVNRDSLPDTAFINGGSVRVLENTSSIVAPVSAGFPEGMPLTLAPGAAGRVFEIGINNPGRFGEDASIAVKGTRVVFNKAVQSGGTWSISTAMTRSEVEQAVASVSLLMDGLLIGTSSTTLVGANGELQINYNSILGNVVPIPASETKQLTVRVTLKPTAASASYKNFYLSHSNTSGVAQVLHGSEMIGRTEVFGWAVSNRISFDPVDLDVIFKDGFE